MAMPEIRVRFPPSPTGFLHIGGARTALYNWLFARKTGGKLVLRIEDTDVERSTEASTRAILDGLTWMGIDWDEGPYLQSEYVEEHKQAARTLLENGSAYRCFCTKEDLAAEREKAKQSGTGDWKYSRKCLNLTAEESARRASAGAPFVVRFRVPDPDPTIDPADPAGEDQTTGFDDIVFGRVDVKLNEVDDFVIVRSDGSPLYIMANVVDDHRDRISHVIRGADHLVNTPKQVLLYKALNWPVPRFAHMALTLDPKKAKISKRRHGEVVTVEFYREHGFLPWGFCNFMVLLGWSPGDDREVFLHPLDLIQAFTLERIRKGNSVFNYRVGDPKFITDPKALSMNADHIRQLPIEELIPHVEAWFKDHDLWIEDYAGPKLKWFVDTIDLLRPRCHTMEDFTELCRAYFSDDYPVTNKALKNIRKDPVLADAFNRLADAYAALDVFDLESTEQTLRALTDEMGIKAGLLINGTRAAVTGQTVGPGLFDVLVAVGKDRVVARLRAASGMVTSSD